MTSRSRKAFAALLPLGLLWGLAEAVCWGGLAVLRRFGGRELAAADALTAATGGSSKTGWPGAPAISP